MPKQYTKYTIIQLVAAPTGWVVVMQTTEGFSENAVACFALTKYTELECGTGKPIGDEGFSVVALIGGEGLLDIAESFDNFYGVYGPNDPRPWEKQDSIT